MLNPLIFISVFDSGSLSLGLNHLKSIVKVGIKNYMAYATDDLCYASVKAAGFNVTRMGSQGSSNKKTFGTGEFTRMSFLRYGAINEQLKLNNAVWYMDVDSVVLDDLNYENLNNCDIVFQNDIHEMNRCTGCMLIFPNKKTISLTNGLALATNEFFPDQECMHAHLNRVKDIKTEMFDSDLFPNGLLYFDVEDLIESYDVSMLKSINTNVYFDGKQMLIYPDFIKIKSNWNKNGLKPKFVHANWIVGVENKIKALKKKNLWFY